MPETLPRTNIWRTATMPLPGLSHRRSPRRLHIALDLAVDLQDAAADDLQPLADDIEIVADHRLLVGFCPGCTEGATDVASCIGAAAELRVNVDFPRLH